MSDRRQKKVKRQQSESDSSSSEADDDGRLPFFVPIDGIDVETLALYSRRILDADARVKIGTHPTKPHIQGYFVLSQVAIGREDIAAMIEDTRLWSREMKATGRRESYAHSETARRRLQIGRARQPSIGIRPVFQMRPSRDETDSAQYLQRSQSATVPGQLLSRDVTEQPYLAMDRERYSSSNLNSPRLTGTELIREDMRRGPTNPIALPLGSTQYMHQQTTSVTVHGDKQPASFSPYSLLTEGVQPPYQEGGDSKPGTQPSTTGSQGFGSRYATSGPPRQNYYRY